MASFFELPNDERLPDGYETRQHWYKWLAQFGLTLMWDHEKIWRDGYWIASVKSKNYSDGTRHAIIMHGTKVAFDPSTKRRYRKGQSLLSEDIVLGGWWVEVTDPALLYKFEEYKRLHGHQSV